MKIKFDPEHIGCGASLVIFISVLLLAATVVSFQVGHWGVGIVLVIVGVVLKSILGKIMIASGTGEVESSETIDNTESFECLKTLIKTCKTTKNHQMLNCFYGRMVC